MLGILAFVLFVVAWRFHNMAEELDPSEPKDSGRSVAAPSARVATAQLRRMGREASKLMRYQPKGRGEPRIRRLR